MSEAADDDPRLAEVVRICLALPEAACERTGRHATFRVRKKTFAYYLNDHHGDGVVGLACKTALGEHEELVRSDPERFYIPAYVGSRGWVGLRLDRGAVDWREVVDLVTASYRQVAPKRLAALADAG